VWCSVGCNLRILINPNPKSMEPDHCLVDLISSPESLGLDILGFTSPTKQSSFWSFPYTSNSDKVKYSPWFFSFFFYTNSVVLVEVWKGWKREKTMILSFRPQELLSSKYKIRMRGAYGCRDIIKLCRLIAVHVGPELSRLSLPMAIFTGAWKTVEQECLVLIHAW
jgi:hypothetical protein